MEISIIIPAYNREKRIEDCLRSILKQDTQNYEIILVDDGSTDSTGKICDRYANEYPFIRVIHSSNFGVSHARNLGIEASKGRYLLFIDSDDTISDDYLYKFSEHMDTVDLVVCQIKDIWFRSNKISISYRPFKKEAMHGNIIENYEDITSLLRLPVCKLYSKSIIEQHHIRFDEEISVFEDQLFNFEYLKYVNSYKVLDCFYEYNHYNETSLSNNYIERYFDDEYKKFKVESEFLEKYVLTQSDSAFWNHIIVTIERYAYYQSLNDNWQDYKRRVRRLLSIRKVPNIVLKNRKRNFILWLLRHQLYEVVMLYYTLKHKLNRNS